MSNKAWFAATGLVCLVLAGSLGSAAVASDELGERVVCRIFPVELREGADPASTGFDTADTSQPIGAWVHEMTERGWRLATVQLAVGQKPTGFPIGYQQVCVSPR